MRPNLENEKKKTFKLDAKKGVEKRQVKRETHYASFPVVSDFKGA